MDERKMNRHLHARLRALRDDVRSCAVDAKSRGIDVVVDIERARACAALYDAYKERILLDAREASALGRARVRASVVALTSNVRAFAKALTAFPSNASSEKSIDKVWNFPMSAHSNEDERVAMKLAFARAVERGVATRRERADANVARERAAREDDLDDALVTSRRLLPASRAPSRALLYACDELAFPRRCATQCALLRAIADDERLRFNAEFLRLSTNRDEIIDRVRAIDRRLKHIDKTVDDDVSIDASASASVARARRSTECDSSDDDGVRLERFLKRDCDDVVDDDAGRSHEGGRANDSRMGDARTILRRMMGDDVVDSDGDVDVEQSDQARIDDQSECDRSERFGMTSATGDGDGDAGDARARAATPRDRSARDAPRIGSRNEARKLNQEASELVQAFDARVRALAGERRRVELETTALDALRARLAKRLRERHEAGDFESSRASDDGDGGRGRDEVEMKRRDVAEYERIVEDAKRNVDSATRAVKSAHRAFRRDVRDNPASSVHVDALVRLYQSSSGILKTASEDEKSNASSKAREGVFPQGLDDRWWDKLVSARAKRAALERDLCEARDAHAVATERMQTLQIAVKTAEDFAQERERAAKQSQRERRFRAFDVDCEISLRRGYVEIPSRDTTDAIERGDLIVISKSRIDAVNKSLRESYAAKLSAEAANARAREDIERAKWDIQTLNLQCEDTAARTTEVALLRVSKRLQQVLFHANAGRADAPASRSREEINEAAAYSRRIDKSASLHAEKMARKREKLSELCAREAVLLARLRSTRAQILAKSNRLVGVGVD